MAKTNSWSETNFLVKNWKNPNLNIKVQKPTLINKINIMSK